MDDTAGISLRPSASLLVTLDGGNPNVVARAKGLQLDPHERKEPQEERIERKGLGGLMDRLVGVKPPVDVELDLFSPERVGGLLGDLKAAAGEANPRRVVIAVPAYAHDGQRQNIVAGAVSAGWEVLGLVNEPVAAAMGSGTFREGDGTAVVYDLSSGSFDVTVVANQGLSFEVLSADGIADTGDTPALSDLLTQTEAPCRRALRDAGLNVDALDIVVLVGERARESVTSEFVTELFGRTPLARFDPEEVVGIGAAIQAHLLTEG